MSTRFKMQDVDAMAAKVLVGCHTLTDSSAFFNTQTLYKTKEDEPNFRIPAIIVAPDGVGQAGDVLLYSSPDWKGGWRCQMTVWVSFNAAATWPIKRLIDPGFSAYSSLAAGKDKTIYLLYESGDKKLYDEIRMAVFNLQWLLKGESF